MFYRCISPSSLSLVPTFSSHLLPSPWLPRVDEPCFPFPERAGFLRSHRLQRRRYKGLANPLCIHGIVPVPSPDLAAVPPHARMRWEEITGELVAVRCRTRGETSQRLYPHVVAALQGPGQPPLHPRHHARSLP
ncbi:unnamed protein product [Closterium sp. NIES-54]